MARPTKMTPEVLRKLETAFTKGCTDTEACCYADIGVRTLYDYCEKHEAFSHRKEKLKDMPLMKARFIINDSLDEQSLATANKVIDREVGKKIQITGANGGALEWDLMLHEANPQSS